MNIYPYDRSKPETHPKKDGYYLLLAKYSYSDDPYWVKSGWSSVGGFFEWELGDDYIIDHNVKVLGYIPLPEISTVLSILEKGEVYNG